jgi:hypothetical protein
MNRRYLLHPQFCFIASILLTLAASASPSLAQQEVPATKTIDGCKVTNLGPAFLTFWEHHATQSKQDQVRDFEKDVVTPFKAIYDGAWANLPISREELLTRSFAHVSSYLDSIRLINANIESTLPARVTTFQKAFPDFVCSTPIYFLYSAGAFDGGVRDVEGKSALMFGVDEIARIHGQKDSALFAHELFHIYHAQVVKEQSEALYWHLWEEGLATYVSRSLNPDLPEDKICCLPDVIAVRPVLPTIASELLLKLDSTSQSDQSRYFLGMQKNLNLPERSGYYVGYLIAQELGKSMSLAELAKLQPAAVRKLEEDSLEKMRPTSQNP